MSVRVARNSRMSRYMAQSLLPYLLSTDPLDGLALGLLGIADRDELHVLLRQHPVQDAGAPAADAHAAEHDALAGRDGAVQAQRGGGDEAGRGNRAAGKHGALEKLPAGEGRQAGSGWRMGGDCELEEAVCVETLAEPNS